MKMLAVRSLILAAAVIAPLSAEAQSATPSVRVTLPSQHVYQLNDTYADTYGGPSLTPIGGSINPASLCCGLTSSGYAFSNNAGLSLSGVFNTGTYALGAYTIVIRSSFTNPGLNGSDGYGKIVDFKNATSQAGYYNYGDGSVNNGYGATLEGDFTEFDNTSPYSQNLFQRTTLTRTAAGQFSVYIGGVQQASFADTFTDFTFSGPNGIARFFSDDYVDSSNNHATDGVVNYIATYDYAMTAGEVESYQYETAVTATPEPASMVLLATGLVGVFGAARRRRKA